MTRKVSYDALIRDLYLSAPRGPMRVVVGHGGYPPFLEAGDVVFLDRNGLEAVRPGELVGVKNDDGDVQLLRFIELGPERSVRLLAPARSEPWAIDRVIGRVARVERGGEPVALRAATSRAILRLAELRAVARQARRRVRLQKSLSGVYWGLVESFDEGISETGDLLITDRCPVGCRFCIYACVPSGTDMDVATVRQAASEFRAAGIPRIRLLGGEPFYIMPHLVRSYRAVRESYPDDRISILTSAYFATSEDATRARLEPMRREGLCHLHLSFDAFHLERYPVACYERVLAYTAAHDMNAALVVHYSDGLGKDLDQLLRLRAQYPFQVRITMVSREGDARSLSLAETSVAGFESFREQALGAPGMELIPEDDSCFRWTVFPSGAVHFCCKDNEQNRVGDLGTDHFPEIQGRLRGASSKNRLNVLAFATGHKGEVSGNPCLTCPLGAEA